MCQYGVSYWEQKPQVYYKITYQNYTLISWGPSVIHENIGI